MEKYKVIFESEHILYSEITDELIQDYLEMVNNPEVSKFISLKSRYFSYENELEWIKEKLKSKKVIFSMIEKKTYEFIGNIELISINDKTGELGICITPKKQNKHYGEEAIKRFIQYCFDILNLEEIELSVYSHNLKAYHLYKKIGFIEYKIEKNVGIYNNDNIDDIYMILKKK